MSERYREEVGGRSIDEWDAHIGTLVFTADGCHLGTVAEAEGKYIAVDPVRGERFWLSVAVVQRANEGGVRLTFDGKKLDDFALTEHAQLEAHMDAPAPDMEERLDPQASEEDKEERREGLVRGQDSSG